MKLCTKTRRYTGWLSYLCLTVFVVVATPLKVSAGDNLIPAAQDETICRQNAPVVDTERLLDPELRPLVAMLPKRGERTPEAMPLIREQFKAWNADVRAGQRPLPPDDVEVREIHILGPEGAPLIRALQYMPPIGVENKSAMLDIHGGSWVLGYPEMNDYRNRLLSKALGMVIISIDYRLAPEHPFPAALDDSEAALTWMHENAEKLGIDPKRIAVSGDSAGGAIAGGLALKLRDEGKKLISYLVLIYPSIGPRPDMQQAPGCQPSGKSSDFAAVSYLGEDFASKAISPYAIPGLATDLSGMPATFIAVGALDSRIRHSSLEFAQQLMVDNVATELHLYPGAIHGFDMATSSHVAQQFFSDLREALKRAFD